LLLLLLVLTIIKWAYRRKQSAGVKDHQRFAEIKERDFKPKFKSNNLKNKLFLKKKCKNPGVLGIPNSQPLVSVPI